MSYNFYKTTRLKSKRTQQELSDLFGVSRNTISNIERGIFAPRLNLHLKYIELRHSLISRVNDDDALYSGGYISTFTDDRYLDAIEEDRAENIGNALYGHPDIETIKPYVLVVGAIGSGKSTYIRGAKMWDKKRRYFAIQSITHVGMIVRINADQIIYIQSFNNLSIDDYRRLR